MFTELGSGSQYILQISFLFLFQINIFIAVSYGFCSFGDVCSESILFISYTWVYASFYIAVPSDPAFFLDEYSFNHSSCTGYVLKLDILLK